MIAKPCEHMYQLKGNNFFTDDYTLPCGTSDLVPDLPTYGSALRIKTILPHAELANAQSKHGTEPSLTPPSAVLI